MIFQTTTAVDMDEELLNRCIVLTVDEGREQTRAIHERQRQARTLEGVIARQERQRILALHQNAQRLIRPLFVVNPYAAELRFPDHQTRMRRDHMKYLGLIEAVALLHQYQRPVKTVEHRGQKLRYIEVTRDDICIANKLAHEVLGRSLDELPPQTRRLLGMLDDLASAECSRLGIERCDFRFSRREVRERTGWSYEQLRVHLGRLVEFEYLLVHRGARGQSFVYELCYDGRGTDGGAFLAGLLDAGELGGATSATATLGGANESLAGRKAELGGSLGAHTGAKPGGSLGGEGNVIQHESTRNRDRAQRKARNTRLGNGQAEHVVAMPVAALAARTVS
jgi:hypothetical protein